MVKRRALPAVLLFVSLTGGSISAQQAAAQAEFDVASVKPNTSGSGNSSTHTTKGLLRMENVSLKSLIQRAYDVRDYSMSGPAWLASERFDIVAKIPADASGPELRAMLQALLKDRFKLAMHWAPKELSGYALVVAKNGPKIHAIAPDGNNSTSTNNNGANLKITAKQTSMDQLADLVGQQINQPVQNLTGLEGVFDFTLEWIADDRAVAPGGDGKAAESPVGPSLFSALPQQLGLRLQGQRVTIRTVVVDNVERAPTGN